MNKLALVMVVATGVAHADPDRDALDAVNRYRTAAGLPEVKLDATLSKGCMEHAEYMRKNLGTEAMAGLNAHKQRANLPGASPAGAACAKAADLFPGVSDLRTAVDGWMAGIYHRRPILGPGLEKLGIGYSKLPNGSLAAALMFVDAKEEKGGWPIAYPASGQKDQPLEYGAEIPNPIPKGGHGGYPITLQFPAFDKVTKVKASLTANGKAIPFYLSDPEHPATSFPQYGVVSIIAKQPLEPGTTYEVRVDATWKGKPKTWTWKFSTLQLRAIEANDIAALSGALGVPSLVRGVVTHGGMLDTATAFLSLADKGKLVSVVMPLDVWKQLGRGAKPASFKGKALEVQATPTAVGDRFINLPIGSARQLKFR